MLSGKTKVRKLDQILDTRTGTPTAKKREPGDA